MIIIKAGEHCQDGVPPPENTSNLTNTVQFIYYLDGIATLIKINRYEIRRPAGGLSTLLDPLFEEGIVVHLVGELR